MSRAETSQRRSPSSRRAESKDNSGRHLNPFTSFRCEKSTPALSSASKRRTAGRPRSRTSKPCFARAAARTHWPVFMCKSRIVIVVMTAQCVTEGRLSTPRLPRQSPRSRQTPHRRQGIRRPRRGRHRVPLQRLASCRVTLPDAGHDNALGFVAAHQDVPCARQRPATAKSSMDSSAAERPRRSVNTARPSKARDANP